MEKTTKVKLVNIVNYINWHDIVYVGIVQLLLRFGFINLFDFKTPFNDFLFLLLFLSVTFITISGYLINSFYKTKQINFLFSSISLLSIGLLTAVLVSYKIEKPLNSLIFLGFSLVVVLVSQSLVNRSFIKTLAISMLMAFSLLIHWWYHDPLTIEEGRLELFLKLEIIIILFSLFIFLGNIIRAIVYSLKNLNRDQEKNKETFPIVFGIKKSKQLIFIICIVISIIAIYSVVIYATSPFTYFVILPLHLITQLYILFKLKRASSSQDYICLLKKLDFILFFSMIYIPIIGYLIKNSVS